MDSLADLSRIPRDVLAHLLVFALSALPETDSASGAVVTLSQPQALAYEAKLVRAARAWRRMLELASVSHAFSHAATSDSVTRATLQLAGFHAPQRVFYGGTLRDAFRLQYRQRLDFLHAQRKLDDILAEPRVSRCALLWCAS